MTGVKTDAIMKTAGLSVGYNTEVILADIDLTFLKGQFISLLGPNGAGKTTLLRTLARLMPPLNGTVFINGTDFTRFLQDQLARTLSVVLTDRVSPGLFSVFEFVALGRYPHTGFLGKLKEADKQVVLASLSQVHAEDLICKQLDTLSDGEKQKVLLARALAQEPRVILLDEPTLHLDLKHRMEVMSILRNLCREKGITVVASLHDVDIAAKVSDRVALVKDGGIFAWGPPEETLDAKTVADLYDFDGVSFNPALGSIEIKGNGYKGSVFVAGGIGSASAVYRLLAKRGFALATGVLHTNDLDYHVAMSLGAKCVTRPPMEEITPKQINEARPLVKQAGYVIDTGFPIRALNRINTKLIKYAIAQAKRRSYCCIVDHLTPAFTNADLYEDLAKVENLLKDYNDAGHEDPGKLPLLRPMIWEAVCGADLDKDLELAEREVFADFDAFLERLHSYLTDLSDTMINDGLHIMGKAPEQDRLVEFLVQLTRLPNGDTPSLRESVLNAMGHGYDDLLENKGKMLPRYKGKTGGWIIQSAHEKALAMVKCLESNRFDTTGINAVVESHMGRTDKNVAVVLGYICEILTPNIQRVTDEIDSSLTGFNGGFVLPGPSGAPSRGQADILPTGRNFFSVDPNKIPIPAAWEVGKSLGDALISRCLEETGKYPENIGIIVWGGSTMRSKGDDIAEIYYLMGVKPVWARGSGNVTGLEIIPSSELRRPRLDVVPRISGFFRDSFPNLVERIDEAARIVAALNEPPESNILRRNVLRDVEKIEIHRGRGALKYGDDASGGVILITTGKIETCHGNIKTYWGNHDTSNYSANCRAGKGAFGIGTSAGYDYTKGYQVNGDQKKQRAGGKLEYIPGNGLSLAFSGDYLKNKRGLSGRPEYPTPHSRKESEMFSHALSIKAKGIPVRTTRHQNRSGPLEISGLNTSRLGQQAGLVTRSFSERSRISRTKPIVTATAGSLRHEPGSAG